MGAQAVDVVGRTTANRLYPQRRLDAQFSVFWAVAVAMATGKLLPSDLVDQIPPTHKVVEWIGKIECLAEQNAVGAREVGRCMLEIETSDGKCFSTEAAQAKGHPSNPMSEAELVEKFSRNLAMGEVPEPRAQAIAAAILALEERTDARSVLRELSALAANRRHGFT
jgi:2-methylcitrate dehydratase PrpD